MRRTLADSAAATARAVVARHGAGAVLARSSAAASPLVFGALRRTPAQQRHLAPARRCRRHASTTTTTTTTTMHDTTPAAEEVTEDGQDDDLSRQTRAALDDVERSFYEQQEDDTPGLRASKQREIVKREVDRISKLDYVAVKESYEQNLVNGKLVCSTPAWQVDANSIALAYMNKFVAVYRPDDAKRVWEDVEASGIIKNPSANMYNVYFLASLRTLLPLENARGHNAPKPETEREQERIECYQEVMTRFEHLRIHDKCDARSYAILTDAYFRLGMTEKAEEVLEDILNGRIYIGPQNGPKTPVQMSMNLYNVFLKWYLRDGEIQKAEEVLAHMKMNRHINITAAPYNMLVAYYVRTQPADYARALALLQEMDEKNVPKDSITYAISLYATFQDMFANNLESSNRSLLGMLVPLSKSLDMQLVDNGKAALRKILNEMRRNETPFTPHVLNTMIMGLIDISTDMYLAELMFVTASRLIPVARRTVKLMFEGHIRQGSLERALVMYRTVLPRLNMNRSVKHLNGLIGRLADEGDMETAFELFEEFVARGEKVTMRTYSLLMRGALQQMPQQAMNLEMLVGYLESIGFIPPRGYLRSMLQQYARQGGKMSAAYYFSLQ
ncbi:uncharacterized protein V1518DRAFT_418877 [Limtongia smithiae]|uniref:uncharacterized protein n=1 Tax=Limtongia smithiae TaxID=1125753 RepID=UPI0034CEA07B